MSRMTNFDVVARPLNAPTVAEPYYDPVVDALTQATANLWSLDWERADDGAFRGFGNADTFSGHEAEFAARLSAAVRTVLPDANIQISAIDLDSAPSTTYQFGPDV